MPGGIQDNVLLFKFSGHLPAHVLMDDRPCGLTTELNHLQLFHAGDLVLHYNFLYEQWG